MIHNPHPRNEDYHNLKINEWWAYEANNYLQDRLRILIVKIKWQKRVTTGLSLTNNDLEIHESRMNDYLIDLDNINRSLKEINIQHDPSRIEVIKQSIINIQQLKHNNYDSKTNI